jgi:hypothetical protein
VPIPLIEPDDVPLQEMVAGRVVPLRSMVIYPLHGVSQVAACAVALAVNVDDPIALVYCFEQTEFKSSIAKA